MDCKYCYRPITKAVLAEKKKRKADNARASRTKALARGTPFGRKKVRDDAQIKDLRDSGLTLREIAQVIGLSTTAVQRSLKSNQ